MSLIMAAFETEFNQNDGGGFGVNSSMVINELFVENGNQAAMNWAIQGMRELKRKRRGHDVRRQGKRPKSDLMLDFVNQKIAVLVPVGAYADGYQASLKIQQMLWLYKTSNGATGEHQPANLPLLNMLLEEAAIFRKSEQLLRASGVLEDGDDDDSSLWGIKEKLQPIANGIANIIRSRSNNNRKLLYATPAPGQSTASALQDAWRIIGCITGFMAESAEYQKNPHERLVETTVAGRQHTRNVFSPRVQVGDSLWFIGKEIPNPNPALLDVHGASVGQRTRTPSQFLQVMGVNMGSHGEPYYFSSEYPDDEAQRSDLRYIEKDVEVWRSDARYIDTLSGEFLTDEQRMRLPPHRWTLLNNFDDIDNASENDDGSNGEIFVCDLPRRGARQVVGRILHATAAEKTTWSDIELAGRNVDRLTTMPLIEVDIGR